MKKYILIADPSKLSRFLLEKLLQEKYNLLVVSSYSEALEALKEALPTVAIISYDLEDGNGLDLCKYLNNSEKFRNVPVIIISSSYDEKTRAKAYESGAIDFFSKTDLNEEFVKYIDELIEILSSTNISSATVFAVDDSIVQLKFIENVLKSLKIDVELFSKPEDLLERIKDKTPDVIISDLYMDNIDGIALTKLLRQNKKLKHVPIIIQTSSRDNSILRTLMVHGANDYLLKPYSNEELLLKFTAAYKSKKLYDELEEINRELFKKATVDPLTNVYNRRFFMEQFNFLFLNAKRYKQNLGFLIIDMDHFKKINDTYGHLCGDEVLKQFAKTLKNTLRQTDIVGRFGGEEFVCLIPNITKNGILMVVKKILNSVRNDKIIFEDKEIKYSVSIGAVDCLDKKNIDEIIKIADELLYEVKSKGRNCACLMVEGEKEFIN